jgi:hypothetical protein
LDPEDFMQRLGMTIRGSATHLGLLWVLAAAGLTACHGDSSTAATDDLGRIASTETGQDCVDFQGNKHCPLGNAKLAPSADGTSLQATGLAAAGKDGVAILLPDVTQFTPSGQIDSKSGTTLVARSINEGVSTSSLNLQRNLDGYAISASFTGSAAGSTYSAQFYNSGQLVGTVGGLVSGGNAMVTQRPCRFPPPGCRWPSFPPMPPWPPFAVLQNAGGNGGSGVGSPGACVWKINFGQANQIQAKLADGSSVLADAVDLVEDVQGQGSYPYLTFNRIDYTTDALDGQIDGEAIK